MTPNTKKTKAACAAALALTTLTAFAPAALAQSPFPWDRHGSHQSQQADRQKNKNDWRNLTIGAGALGVYGLLTGNKTATVLGAAGAAYSANRYEQDRKSQSQQQHSRDDWRDYHRDNYNRYHRTDRPTRPY